MSKKQSKSDPVRAMAEVLDANDWVLFQTWCPKCDAARHSYEEFCHKCGTQTTTEPEDEEFNWREPLEAALKAFAKAGGKLPKVKRSKK